MEWTQSIRLKNAHSLPKESVFVSVFFFGGGQTYGPFTVAAGGGEIKNVLPPHFDKPITGMRFNWTIEGQPRRQDIRAQSEYYYEALLFEWEESGRRRLTHTEQQTQEMVRVEYGDLWGVAPSRK